MPKHLVSPPAMAENIWRRLRKAVGISLMSSVNLKEAWYEVLENFSMPIDREYAVQQWRRLHRSLRRIERQQEVLAEQGNLSKRQMRRRIQLRNNDSIRESARQVVIEQLESNALDSDDLRYARLLHTSADEPDLAHTMLEGKILPLPEVLQEIRRFGCQHEYEIVEAPKQK